ncbi:hypothetical protein ACWEWX_04800 [Streptomyces asiaticus]
MAISITEPLAVPDDLVTIKEAVALLRPTPYPPSDTTVRRWIARHGLFVRRAGGRDYVSFTDLLEAQRDEAARQRPGP